MENNIGIRRRGVTFQKGRYYIFRGDEQYEITHDDYYRYLQPDDGTKQVWVDKLWESLRNDSTSN